MRKIEDIKADIKKCIDGGKYYDAKLQAEREDLRKWAGAWFREHKITELTPAMQKDLTGEESRKFTRLKYLLNDDNLLSKKGRELSEELIAANKEMNKLKTISIRFDEADVRYLSDFDYRQIEFRRDRTATICLTSLVRLVSMGLVLLRDIAQKEGVDISKAMADRKELENEIFNEGAPATSGTIRLSDTDGGLKS